MSQAAIVMRVDIPMQCWLVSPRRADEFMLSAECKPHDMRQCQLKPFLKPHTADNAPLIRPTKSMPYFCKLLNCALLVLAFVGCAVLALPIGLSSG